MPLRFGWESRSQGPTWRESAQHCRTGKGLSCHSGSLSDHSEMCIVQYQKSLSPSEARQWPSWIWDLMIRGSQWRKETLWHLDMLSVCFQTILIFSSFRCALQIRFNFYAISSFPRIPLVLYNIFLCWFITPFPRLFWFLWSLLGLS